MDDLTNRQYKEIKALIERVNERKKKRLFTAEGLRFFNEIPKDLIKTVVVSETFHISHPEISAFVLNDDKYKTLSDTKHPQGILAVIREPENKEFEIDADKGLYLILEDIRDPGNLGTIVRTAEAAGVSGIIMSKGSADVYSPKVVRSTMGSIFRVPFFYADDVAFEAGRLKEAGVTLYAAHLSGRELGRTALSEKRAFLIGNEGNGLSEGLAELADEKIKIPMHGQVESLNAAIAAAILMYSV